MQKFNYSLSEIDCNTVHCALCFYFDELSKTFSSDDLKYISELIDCFGSNREFYKEHE